jgi:hypothetical protein
MMHIIEAMENRLPLWESDVASFRFETILNYPNFIEKVYYHGCHMGDMSVRTIANGSTSTDVEIKFTPANEPSQAP